MTISEHIYALPDDKVGAILERALAGIAGLNTDFAELRRVKAETIKESLANESPALVASLEQVESDAPRAAQVGRELLVALADDPALTERVRNAVETNRDVLFEPILTAAILTSLVIALSIRFKIVYRSRNDGNDLTVEIEKKATSDKIIERVLAIGQAENG